MKKKRTINLVQDVATPHNNILIKELLKNKSVNLNLWYALKGSNGVKTLQNNIRLLVFMDPI